MSQLRLHARRLTALCLLTAVVVLAVPGRAAAEPPLRLDTQITDQVGALAGRESEVDQALQRLEQDTGWQLFVVYVDDFDGTPALDWADQTAVASSLGARDALLAVAVVERAYAYSVDDRFPLTDDQLDEVAATAIEPALAADDWAAAAIGAADGYRQAAAAGPGTDNGDDGLAGGRTAMVMCLVTLAGAVVALLAWTWWYRRDQRRRQLGKVIADGPYPDVPTEDLTARANTMLIDTDNAVTGADGELGLATAQYGAQATASFVEALAAARADLAEAFRLRTQLDEPAQGSDAAARELAQRQLLTGIIGRCTAAADRLDAESAAFDALRDLENRLDQVIDELTTRQRDAGQRLPAARAELAGLSTEFAGPVLDSVDGNVTQAEELLSFATAELQRAAALAGSDERSTAAVAVRTAGDALVQVDALLAAVMTASGDLRAAHAAIAGLVAEVATDLAAGQGALRGGAPSAATPQAGVAAGVPAAEATALASAVAGAEQVLTAVHEQLARRPMDPVAALRQLEHADRALDAALGAVRDAAQRVARARAVLPQAIMAARAEITATASFISTRRGAVGGTARSHLAEAQRLLDHAVSVTENDPVQALASAHRADQLAEGALQAAWADVQRWAPPAAGWGHAQTAHPGTGAFLGGLLGSSGQRHGWSSRSSSSFSSARRSSSGSSRRSGSGGASRRGGSGRSSSGGRRGGGSSGGRRGGGSGGRRGGGGRF
ncbi:TPM domain-containing protein [Micromonospora sp. NBC_01813]|uniref:TPM domain-containing protein n=1 Tax=Micromonospora sp. NBC_01813 TaxID=2975988 RepID=UPI002DD834FB|nr:TPM domain-containing protein [Micromonospora sp. NBC_01813]WSA10675.1 TPM domain-containing protein [Micromonospora sp. NBC_01813]